ncbi:radical SAM protein [Pseudodesulfovibrio sp. zrk46]|uniref:elongator complex protein 3 n=1 Tax=Pseudodesulfovibrio sp. zrk46 TaxID=2725288 RepID=UPI001449A3C0|nr:radical SAM protein [Pseudodesulfovibrio sp. zrk46]QJB55756.1 radical SAM protein [Pseudodesulfovibrio sp. zrk46]
MSNHLTFTHPEPEPSPTKVWPVFLPFAGCPYRCVFCAQDKQTGRTETALESILKETEKDLDQALSDGRGPYELAFYGGTFTALPSPWPEMFLGLAMRYRERGLITHVRCSTRPDCVDEFSLSMLRAQGLDMVELGIQSFDDEVLRRSGRGYSGETALQGCSMVQRSGLALGVQLLPGLPGDRPGVFLDDVRTAALLGPEVARIYPCLVIDGTPLAEIWRKGEFEPWSLERAKQELGEALLAFWEKGVRVIRLGLPPEGTLAEHILAGPWHPALGQSARGLALLEIVRANVAEFGSKPELFEVPRRYQGELMGHGNELKSAYAKLGLSRDTIRYVTEEVFSLN